MSHPTAPARSPPPRCVRCQYDLASITPTDDFGEPAVLCPECGYSNRDGEWHALTASTSSRRLARHVLRFVVIWLGMAVAVSGIFIMLTSQTHPGDDPPGGPFLPCCTMLSIAAALIVALISPWENYLSSARENRGVWGPHWRVRMLRASTLAMLASQGVIAATVLVIWLAVEVFVR